MSLTPRIDKLQRNILINGSFEYWQRGSSPITTINAFLADRWRPSAANITTQLIQARSTDVPFGGGYSLSLGAGATISPAAGTLAGLIQPIEGLLSSHLNNKKIGITYYVKANHSATYSGAIVAGASLTDTYAWSFQTIANQWVRVDQIVDLTGHTINHVGTAGISFLPIELLASSDRLATAGTWVTGTPARRGITGQKNFFDTIGNTILISKAMIYSLEGGDQLVNNNEYLYAGVNLANELILCQRYFEKSNDLSEGVLINTNGYMRGQNGPNSIWRWWAVWKVTKRSAPSVTWWNPVSGAINQAYVNGTGITATVISTSVAQASGETNGGNANGDTAVAWYADAEL